MRFNVRRVRIDLQTLASSALSDSDAAAGALVAGPHRYLVAM